MIMKDRWADAVRKGRRAGRFLGAMVLAGCAAGAQPLDLPAGHPADPATPGTDRPAEAAPVPAPAPAAETYVCPMHPEVTSDAPGRCPKCGMALKQVPR
jgi:hypothetical protein